MVRLVSGLNIMLLRKFCVDSGRELSLRPLFFGLDDDVIVTPLTTTDGCELLELLVVVQLDVLVEPLR